MKTTACLCLLAIISTGCTVTKISAPGWTFSRTSFLQRVEIPSVEISTNGAAKMKGYSNDGGNEAAAAIVAAGVAAAMKGVK